MTVKSHHLGRTLDPRWRPVVTADSDQLSSLSRLVAVATAACTVQPRMSRGMITDSLRGVAVFPGLCAARLVEVRRPAKCVAGRALWRVAWLTVTRALQGWPLPCLLFTGGSGGSGGTALGGRLLMGPKITRTPGRYGGNPAWKPLGQREREETTCTPFKGSNRCSRKRSAARHARNGEIGEECCSGPCNIYPNSEDKTDTSSKRTM
ncbi:hypothetical protein NDU88_000913 [Pleurodeles waltl]|uniref:Uncharacterized protein n=1 Tax=Pleurodeles waltl TaxID=8319 RepID=A0AAV7TH57_PLEWA|nr:hypothetical protein NDU88_000913 [Pleurodeles waltl]